MYRDNQQKCYGRAVKFLAMLAACVVAGAAQAGAAQSAASIRNAAADFVKQHYAGQSTDLEITPGRLDSRLRLPACQQPLETFLPAGAKIQHNSSVGVRCPAPHWSLYVPVTVVVYARVLVASEPLSRGTALNQGQFRTERRDTTTLSWGYFTDPADLAGRETARFVAAGAVLTPGMVQRPVVIERGQRVMLRASAGGVKVTMQGEALGRGRVDERVRVRNLSSKRIVEGVVRANGVVDIPGA